jgi:hypothetical protein
MGNQLLHAGVAMNDGESHIVAPSSTPTYVTVSIRCTFSLSYQLLLPCNTAVGVNSCEQ